MSSVFFPNQGLLIMHKGWREMAYTLKKGLLKAMYTQAECMRTRSHG